MSPSGNVRHEKRALDGNNESQDSQELYEAYMRRGIGIMSSSPLDLVQQTASSQGKTSDKRTAVSGSSLNLSATTRGTRDVSGNVNSTHRGPVSPPGSEEDSQEGDQLVRGDASKQSADARLIEPPAGPGAGPGSSAKSRKMDSSQSQTQSNDGRSYEQYFRSSPTRKWEDGADPTVKPAESVPEATMEDDMGDVKFDFDTVRGTNKSLSFRDGSSAVGFGLTRSRDMAPQNPQFPETPAPPQNPFRQSRSQLLAPSQLFGGTQFSSAIKIASPTSSRPSPDDFHPHNSISPNPPAVISSPLKARGLRSTPIANLTSSPQILPGTTSTALDAPSSPPGTISTRNPVIPDSQGSRLQKKTSLPEPMSTYEPMGKSQERRSASLASGSGSSADEDDSIVRRRKAKARKDAALKQLNAISFTRPVKSDDIEVPSTNKRRRGTEGERYLAQGYGSQQAAGQETVQDSQENTKPEPVPDEESTQSEAEVEPLPDTAPALPIQMSPILTQGGDDRISGDAIPETSPPGLRPEIGGPSNLPLAAVKADFQSSPPALSTRSRRARAQGSTSSLSNLATTPVVSSSTTPASQTSKTAKPVAPIVTASSSPVPLLLPKGKRREAAERLSRFTTSTDSLRVSARRGRRMSSSTDELSRSASATPTFEHSLRMSRVSASKSSRTISKARGPKIFDGMAFAISFQSKKPGESNDQYNSRMEFAGMIERRIKQAGGRVLDAGFDELFEASSRTGTPSGASELDRELSLNGAGRCTGFTALIADGHSRKVKYMQALALGLPCIASRWITSCLDRGELLDWMPYLLCAGQSAFLGDAIRSRSLTPYNTASARLASVIGERTKLLEGSRILLVVKKALEGRKMAYVFLARVLGASVARVYSVEEAKAEVKAAEEAGQPFDWVYVDGKENAGDLVTGAGKKRKRTSTATGDEPAGKRIRTLSDELVIQSLILGRMIEEGEMGAL